MEQKHLVSMREMVKKVEEKYNDEDLRKLYCEFLHSGDFDEFIEKFIDKTPEDVLASFWALGYFDALEDTGTIFNKYLILINNKIEELNSIIDKNVNEIADTFGCDINKSEKEKEGQEEKEEQEKE